ncbi:MAG TPA: PEP-utilizing enzyme, partial [Tepidiformaceae bacterium]|nr:PEP-utilizing enzyme [Tepidiformaceae bacterium]
TDAELFEATDRLVAWYRRIWHIHFELLVPALVGISTFQDVYQDLFPDSGPLDAYRLLQGFDSMSLEAGRELWTLSRTVKANPGLREVFENTAPNELAGRLASIDAGRAFLADFSAYLAFYGRRSDGVQELAAPSWTEDPTPAFTNLKAYLDQDEDPDARHARLAAERETLVRRAREAIASYPAPVRDQFELLLAAGAAASRVQEDHNFWIDQRSLHEVRQLCLEYGRRLVNGGMLREPHEVLLLTMDEAQELLRSGGDANQMVAERRAEMAYWSMITPPPMIGMDYGPPPDNPVTRAISRFFGPPPQAAETPGDLQGNAGSPGTARGIARVVMSIAESSRLHHGEILVAPTTAPPWTPLFATAAAVVTDTGGVLSHCAIVAREYGIPAAVGVPGATSIIKDGMTIEVDGSRGTVRILS